MSAEDARHLTFNVRPLDELHTVEVRMHNGTLEARKILLWLSLWQRLLWRAEDLADEVPATPDIETIVPDGDIVTLAHDSLPGATASFLARLDARRREIAESWRNRSELRQWLGFADRWQRD